MDEAKINLLLRGMAVFGSTICLCCVPSLSNNPSWKAGRFIFQFGVSLVLGAIFISKIME